MIRPITCIAFLTACGSGLYLYQAKHKVQLLDHRIEQTVRTTDQLRDQIRMLHAEWTLLNDPERLRQLADQFLALKTVSPTQFTSLAELDSRLPPVPVPKADPAAPATDIPIAQAEPEPPVNAAEPSLAPKPAEIARAAPATKVAAAAAAAPPHAPPEHHVAPPHPAVAQSVRPPEPHMREARNEARMSEARPVVAAAAPTPAFVSRRSPPPIQGVTQVSGSLLGMANRSAVPPPVPLPQPASLYRMMDNGGGGGG